MASGGLRAPAAHSVGRRLNERDIGRLRHLQKTIGFPVGNAVALAGTGFQTDPIDHRDVAALVANASGDLKLERRLRHALSSDAHDLGDEFVGYVQFIRRLAIHEHEQPPTQLLIDGVVPIA
jgi:hypothetical protein